LGERSEAKKNGGKKREYTFDQKSKNRNPPTDDTKPCLCQLLYRKMGRHRLRKSRTELSKMDLRLTGRDECKFLRNFLVTERRTSIEKGFTEILWGEGPIQAGSQNGRRTKEEGVGT